MEHLKIAAKKPRKFTPICVEESTKVMDALQAADYHIQPIYKYILEADECFDRTRREKKKPKATTLYHLSKYVDQRKNKQK
eukprot:CAMPEP_0202449484 /NCGR_PEP_ID=MMETSP1360-20130828/8215_1 /ASSEMBLY_ACC=CAM_ASM_000848 /TAXON_ID=515479 /ORGANISM="Licmophora paradoxa, Strain CCMP2313" /LENGTH=80 /DNA_ID=CAMNT_0049067423 /DNA_START=117 /DNA_END=359 /DNA_ORIENTATION=-